MNIDWHGVRTQTGEWKYPVPNATTNTWWVWDVDADEYVDSGAPARGPQGDPGIQGVKGDPGRDGRDGTGVYVTDIDQSSVDGGANYINFSDGTTLIVRNGNTGAAGPAGKDGKDGLPGRDGDTGPQGIQGIPGTPGTSVTVADVSESDVDGGANIVTFSDGTTLAVKNGNTGSQGPRGYQGQTGLPGKDGKDGKDGQSYEITEADYDEIAGRVDTMIAGERQQALDDIDDAKTDAVADVAAEGVTQIGLVEAKGEEVMESIPSDYSELSADVSSLKADFTQLTENKADIIVSSVSGAIASFNDGANYPVKQTVFTMNPVQDLHGQEYPYPGGGNKNLFETTATDKTQSGVTWKVNADGSVTATGTATDGTTLTVGMAIVSSAIGNVAITVTGISAETNISKNWIRLYDANDNVLATIASAGLTNNKIVFDLTPYSDAHDIRVSIKRNNNAVVNGTVTIQVEKGTEFTDWIPYENICPITGHAEVDAVRTGKNIADETKFDITRPDFYTGQYWLGLSEDNGVFTETRPLGWGGFGYVYVGTFNPCDFTLSVAITDVASVTCAFQYLANKPNTWTEITHGNNVSITSVGRYAFSASIAEPFDLWVIAAPYTSNGAEVKFTDIQLELGSAASTYHAYSGQSVTYQLGQTVYAGTLTINEDGSGQIVSKMAKTVLDGSVAPIIRNWRPTDTSSSWLYSWDDFPVYVPPSTDMPKLFCDSMRPITYNVMYAGNVANSIAVVNSMNVYSFAVRIAEPNVTTASAIAAYLSNNPIEVVYELATPVTINLTEQEVLTLLKGQNNVWHSANGDTEVTYRADTKAYVDGLVTEENTSIIAPTETGTTASQAYAVGKYFLLDGKFCKAKTSIASGATFTLNTNYEVTTIADELYTALHS